MKNLHNEIVRKHNTVKYQSQYGSVSIRKTGGRYHVYLDDYETQNEIRADFATLRGAEIMFDNLKDLYL